MIKVVYWLGTTQREELVSGYDEALEIASRNKNTSLPRFYDDDNTQLYDDGNGLFAEDDEGIYRY